ncbi:ATP-binding protein [Pelagicoccus mobilis]|uniref:histidine kinase n=1 Tax=Pelagicoccus mobilis TaxID=415221 RepID=A0A934RTT1_9BACT|nr:ATP-binding protein [Pelagicoccus mobilis]MBK1876251.1 hypothetical protein [Pelagicoccus mobilis]
MSALLQFSFRFRTTRGFLSLIVLFITAFNSSAADDKGIETFLEFGAIKVDRYTPRQTGVIGEIRSIHTLPNGDIGVLTAEDFITFNGTHWDLVPELERPTRFFNNPDGSALVGHAAGISRIEVNEFGRNQFTLLTPAEFITHSLHSPRYVASARGHIFGNHGTHLIVIKPDGSFHFHELENWASSLFAIGDEIYTTGGRDTLLNRWDWDKEKLVNHDSVLSDSVYEWFNASNPRANGGVWMLTQKGDFVGFDGEKSWMWPGNEILHKLDTTITSFIESGPDQLVVGTSTKGIFFFNEDGSLKRSVSKDQGLDSMGVIGLGHDSQGGIWAATKRSLNRIPLNPATLLFDERHGISSTVDALALFNDDLYLATPIGIFKSDRGAENMESLFQRLYSINTASDLLVHQDRLFIAGEHVFAIDKEGNQIELQSEGGSCLWQPSHYPDALLMGNYQGVSISRFVDGEWSQFQKIDGVSKEVFSFSESENGTILGGNGDSTITRIHITDTSAYAELIEFEIPTQGIWTTGTTIEGKIYTNTTPALVWDDNSEKFVTEKSIEYFKGIGPYGFEHSFSDDDENSWVSINPRRGLAITRPNRKVVSEISSLNDALETRASSLVYDAEGRAWAGGDFGLILATNPHTEIKPAGTQPDIHRLTSLKDNVDLPNRAGSDGRLHLAPHQNSLRIEAYFNHFHSTSHNTFQIYIEGLDTEWGPFETFSFREVTNIVPGDYTIIINCLNADGQQSSFYLPISIAAPWHKKSWAYALFTLLGVLFVVFIVWGYNRNQIRRRKRLEQLVNERTQEVEDQNTMLARQAEALEKQNEELGEKTEELTATTETLTSTLHQLQETQDQLLETARTAGKAEIAINVLHNVGNVLNSLNVSLNLVGDKMEKSKIGNLTRVASLLESHKDDIDTFLTQDPKGKAVPNYLIHLADTLTNEVDSIQHELGVMGEDVHHIKNIIAAQQTHAKTQSLLEEIDLRELCENALSILGSEVTRSKIEIINDIPASLTIENDRHKLIDIILNLITNAQDAIRDEDPAIGTITFSAQYIDDSTLQLQVTDNGSGIEPDTLKKLFRHGFTTKVDGHGFGLHSCANTAQALGGNLEIKSAGKHQGATAILTLPRSQKGFNQNPDTKMATSEDIAN